MNEQLQKQFKEYKAKKNAYQMALSTMYFDLQTIAPKDGKAYRNEMVAILSGEAFAHETDPNHIKMIEEIAKQDLDDVTRREIDLLLRDLENNRVLPKEVYIAYQKAIADSQQAWQEAKQANDYKIFQPYLEQVIQAQKEVLTYVEKDCSDYDYLLDRFQEGMNLALYDEFFNAIKQELVPFIKQLQNASAIDDSKMFQPVDTKKQEQFMQVLLDHLQVDQNKVYVCESEHPFTDFFSTEETRITTHYYEDNLMSAIFSTIHEYGHANYGLKVNPEYNGTTLKDDIGFAMHESQSRFLENNIARRASFWKPLYPKFIEIFDEFKEVSFDEFMKMINVSYPSFIRTEADELTYPIHILIRYELEKEIFNGNLDLQHLDQAWNDKYEEYLGICPSCDRDGILQDMHWGASYFGYFPTYALGSAFAAQFMYAMEQEFDVDACLEVGNLAPIYDWLQNHIHTYGAYKTFDEIIKEATNHSFDVSYYIQYLKEKYSTIYQL